MQIGSVWICFKKETTTASNETVMKLAKECMEKLMYVRLTVDQIVEIHDMELKLRNYVENKASEVSSGLICAIIWIGL